MAKVEKGTLKQLSHSELCPDQLWSSGSCEAKCPKCGMEGIKERLEEEGNHHKRSCCSAEKHVLAL